MEQITLFRWDYAFLSNFQKCQVEFEGDVYPTVEHAFQAAKTFDKEERQKILSTASPVMAKRIGRRVCLREDWKDVKCDIMLELLKSKFSNEPYLGETRTTDKILCECVIYSVTDEKEVIQEYIDKCTNLIEATKVKKEINKILKNVRFISRCVSYAIELSEKKGSYDWSELEKIPRTKDKYAQTCQVPGLGRMYELKRMVYKKEF